MMPAIKKYNGWTNYETWCVNLWLTNEASTEQEVRMLAQMHDVSVASHPTKNNLTQDVTILSILDKATCGCCDTVRQYIGEHLDPSGDGIRTDSDPSTIYTEIEAMFEGQDDGSGITSPDEAGITLAHLEEYISSLEAGDNING